MDNKLKKTELELHDFLTVCGASLLEPTNSWELCRFRDCYGIHVIYFNKKMQFTYSDEHARQAFEAFQKGESYQATEKHVRVKRTLRADAIIARDGDNCFFCGKPMGEDITLEHLLPIAKGGNNTLHNLVLCHEECNRQAGSMSIAEKVALRDRLRKELEAAGMGN